MPRTSSSMKKKKKRSSAPHPKNDKGKAEKMSGDGPVKKKRY